MYFKLARKNVRKSFRDFTVYFLTLVFGVSVFYMFNSLDAQQELMAFTESRQETLVALTQILAYFSGFVSVVLGFLVVYANGFLIRRRKQELGMYMLLGMGKWKIARILVYETLIIGVAALGVGLGIGVLLSQVMSIFTANLFEVNMTGFHFVFSAGGAGKAIVYFGVIFLIAVLFSAVSVSRYKLIDLFQASKKNEELKLRSIMVSMILFAVSVVCLGAAYGLILRNGLLDINIFFTMSILLGSIGTFLFFMSLSGFLLRTFQTSPRTYFRNLNMFVLRQINSKINTTYASMTIVCLALLLTIGTFSSGMGISMAVSQDLDVTAPYDYSITQYEIEEEASGSILANINERFGSNAYLEAVEVWKYDSGLSFGEMKDLAGVNLQFDEMASMHVDMIKLSELNALRRMNGQYEVVLDQAKFALVCTNSDAQEFFVSLFEKTKTLVIGGISMGLQNEQMIETNLETGDVLGGMGVFVLRDDEFPEADVQLHTLNMNFKDEDQAKRFQSGMNQWFESSESRPFHRAVSREDILEAGVSTRTILSFLAIYLGFVFLIASAAILALQQLSEAADNRARYELLRKIGADKRMVNQSIFFQVFLYFFMPLGLAIVHSVVGLKVANDVIRMVGEMDIVGNLMITALFILVIYGGYFLATFLGVKVIVAPQSDRIRE